MAWFENVNREARRKSWVWFGAAVLALLVTVVIVGIWVAGGRASLTVMGERAAISNRVSCEAGKHLVFLRAEGDGGLMVMIDPKNEELKSLYLKAGFGELRYSNVQGEQAASVQHSGRHWTISGTGSRTSSGVRDAVEFRLQVTCPIGSI